MSGYGHPLPVTTYRGPADRSWDDPGKPMVVPAGRSWRDLGRRYGQLRKNLAERNRWPPPAIDAGVEAAPKAMDPYHPEGRAAASSALRKRSVLDGALPVLAR